MKVLTVCIGGVVRSVAIADVLRNNHGIDAIPLSAVNNSKETFEMLCDWADKIIMVEPRDAGTIPPQYKGKWQNCYTWECEKTEVFDIGLDKWGSARHPELTKLINNRIKEIL